MTPSDNGQHQAVNGNGAPDPAWSNEALIRHAQAHPEDSEAFTLLHARHAGWLVKRARWMVSASEAEDVSQETFLYLWRKLPSLEPPFRLTGLLSKVVHDQCVNVLRRRKRRETAEGGADVDSVPAPPPKKDDSVLKEQMRLALPQAQFRALWLHYCEGLPCVEIAEAEGVPAATVRWRIHAAIKRLRDRKDFSNISPRSSVNQK